MTGIDMLHVPYRGVAPAITDLLGAGCTSYSIPCPRQSDRQSWRAAGIGGITTVLRSEALPNIPAVAEFASRL